MAVPKKKTSRSKTRQRNSANSKHIPGSVVEDKTTGEKHIPHRMTASGYYNGMKVLKKKAKVEETEE